MLVPTADKAEHGLAGLPCIGNTAMPSLFLIALYRPGSPGSPPSAKADKAASCEETGLRNGRSELDLDWTGCTATRGEGYRVDDLVAKQPPTVPFATAIVGTASS